MRRKLFIKCGLILAFFLICVYFTFPLEKRINLGLDLKGGMHLILKVDASRLPADARHDAIERALEVVRNRIDQFGVSEPVIQRQGNDEIVVQLPGVTDRARAIDIIGKTALLEFKLVSEDKKAFEQAISAGAVPEGLELKVSKDDEREESLLLEKTALLTGDAIKDATVQFDSGNFGEPSVGLTLNADGAAKFARITRENVGRRLAIVLDGVVQSAPRINEAIPSGRAVISGRFTTERAQDLAIVLRVGALPAPMTVEEERTIGPLLGQDSIKSGINASIIGLAVVFSLTIIYYLLSGLVAVAALIFNLFIITGVLGMLPSFIPNFAATLTLPGIAGIVLTLGMAVDANVLINERIREELKAGKALRNAINLGYDKAFSAIFDSNVTTLVAAFFLYQFGTGPIRGFAVTLTIGLLASMFTAVVVTKKIFELFLLNPKFTRLHMVNIFPATRFDFIRFRRLFYAVSLAIIIVGMFYFFKQGKGAYGIDFSEGQLQEFSFQEPIPIEQFRSALNAAKIPDAVIQTYKDNPKVVSIKTAVDTANAIPDVLKNKFPNNKYEIMRVEKVGASVGKQLRWKAVWAMFWAMIGLLVYVAIRFKHVNFAVAGVIALLHDILVTLGILALSGRQIDLLVVTALLTIAGFSINDTIVIYDRVRENARLLKKTTLGELINLSVNQTLSRTILTSGLTLMVVVALFFKGGEVLNTFAFALIIGFISGIYSTVFIASPLVLAWSRKKAF